MVKKKKKTKKGNFSIWDKRGAPLPAEPRFLHHQESTEATGLGPIPSAKHPVINPPLFPKISHFFPQKLMEISVGRGNDRLCSEERNHCFCYRDKDTRGSSYSEEKKITNPGLIKCWTRSHFPLPSIPLLCKYIYINTYTKSIVRDLICSIFCSMQHACLYWVIKAPFPMMDLHH